METWRRKHSGKTFTVFGLSRKRMYSSLVDGYKLPLWAHMLKKMGQQPALRENQDGVIKNADFVNKIWIWS